MKVCVIIPCFNRADIVGETIESVLAFIGVGPSGIDEEQLAFEAHASTAGRARGRLGRLARRVPGHGVIAKAVPARALELWHRATSRQLEPTRLELADDTRRRLIEALAPDVARLRAWLGDDFDGWGIA